MDPASRPGIVPLLHPYGFGTILGRSFVALRHNPKVLLGFALVVQAVAYIVVTAAIAGVAIASFSRLDTVPYGSDDYDAIIAGSIALTAIAALVLGILSGVLGVVVQGIVVAEVAHAVVAEKPSLRAVWARVRPVFWRLVGATARSRSVRWCCSSGSSRGSSRCWSSPRPGSARSSACCSSWRSSRCTSG